MPEPSNDNQTFADALAIWQAGVAAVDAQRLVRQSVRLTRTHLHVADQVFDRDKFDRVLVLGAGKASGWMAAGFEEAMVAADASETSGLSFLQQRVTGWVNVPDDQVITLQSIHVAGCRPAGVNLPTERVLEGTTRILQYCQAAGSRDLVLFLIAGGGSALLEQPVHPVSLNDFRFVTTMLSQRGANIFQLNNIRRAISQVKGGRLAAATHGKCLLGLIVSDVIGDPLEMIASGPTIIPVDPADDPLGILEQFDPGLRDCPASILQVLKSNSPLQWDSHQTIRCRIHNHVIANNQTAVAAAKTKAIELGYTVDYAETRLQHDDAEALGRHLADEAMSLGGKSGRHCRISGGEPTVSLCQHPGRGGRNQHLVLAALQRLSDCESSRPNNFCVLSAGTDGEDGNVPVAGAYLNSEIVSRAQSESWHEQINSALVGHNSFELFEKMGTLICVPPTRTNVCDLRIMVSRS